MAPVDYEKWQQAALKEELASRQLPTSGTNPELAARLRDSDTAAAASDDLLGGTPPPPAPAPAQPQTAGLQIQPEVPPAPLGPPQVVNMADPNPPAEPARTYLARYEFRGDLSTSQHEDNRHRAYNEAIGKGLTPRGGLAGVSRIGMEAGPGGAQIAVYEVLLRRK